MWDDVIIGTGDRGTTAEKINGFDDPRLSLSQNDTSYWIPDCFIGIGATIFKNTPEGQVLSLMIENGVHQAQIHKWLSELVVSLTKPDELIYKIEDSQRESYRKGKADKCADIRKTLGL